MTSSTAQGIILNASNLWLSHKQQSLEWSLWTAKNLKSCRLKLTSNGAGSVMAELLETEPIEYRNLGAYAPKALSKSSAPVVVARESLIRSVKECCDWADKVVEDWMEANSGAEIEAPFAQ